MLPTHVWHIRINRVTVAGVVATIVASLIFTQAPSIIEFDAFQKQLFDLTGVWLWENPFPSLQGLAGIVGGFVAGYLTREKLYDAAVHVLQSVLIGLVGFYLIDVGVNLYTVLGNLSVGLDIVLVDIVMTIVIQRFLFLFIPFAFVYTIEGLVVGGIGYWIRRSVVSRLDFDLSVVPAWVVRETAGVAIFLFVIWGTWWIIYLTEAAYA